ncbi:MAG: DUF2752 domain-containing protein [Chitinophagales bacterium]
MKKRSKSFFYYLKKTILIALPIVLLALPADFFDNGQSICISVLLLDMECYGCGMTRAIQHLIHLDIESAMHYNKISLFVLPCLIFLWYEEITKS